MLSALQQSHLRCVAEAVTWPALNVGLGAELMAVQRQYDASQWWPLETLLAEQFRQLRHLVAHAAAHIPFHRERLHAAGIDPAQPENRPSDL